MPGFTQPAVSSTEVLISGRLAPEAILVTPTIVHTRDPHMPSSSQQKQAFLLGNSLKNQVTRNSTMKQGVPNKMTSLRQQL